MCLGGPLDPAIDGHVVAKCADLLALFASYNLLVKSSELIHAVEIERKRDTLSSS